MLGIVARSSAVSAGDLIFHKDAQSGFLQPSGIIGAVIMLLIYSRLGKRSSGHR